MGKVIYRMAAAVVGIHLVNRADFKLALDLETTIIETKMLRMIVLGYQN